MYKCFFKRLIDLLLSFLAIVVLIPVWIILAIAIFISDPGPIFFTQKRVGKKKKLFKILKFRTMKTSTPHDMPTHMLENPEQYITKVGGFLRKTSLDELPQIFNIFAGQMSIIGPRPALWNQDDLIAERDKYGANKQLKDMVDNNLDASVCNLILTNDEGKIVDKRQRRYFNDGEPLNIISITEH